jgi:hypothetical protein
MNTKIALCTVTIILLFLYIFATVILDDQVLRCEEYAYAYEVEHEYKAGSGGCYVRYKERWIRVEFFDRIMRDRK